MPFSQRVCHSHSLWCSPFTFRKRAQGVKVGGLLPCCPLFSRHWNPDETSSHAHKIPFAFISNFLLHESFHQRAGEPYYTVTQLWFPHSHGKASVVETPRKGSFIWAHTSFFLQLWEANEISAGARAPADHRGSVAPRNLPGCLFSGSSIPTHPGKAESAAQACHPFAGNLSINISCRPVL